MLKKVANYFVFYLGTFRFTTETAIGRITFSFVLLLKRQIFNSSEARENTLPLKTFIIDTVKDLWSKKRRPYTLHLCIEILRL